MRQRAHVQFPGVLILVIAVVVQSAGATSTCDTYKLKAAGRKAANKLRCFALTGGGPADPACLQRAEDRFNADDARAETAGSCASPGNAAEIEADIDQFVTEFVASLGSPASPVQTRCVSCKLRAARGYASCLAHKVGSGIRSNAGRVRTGTCDSSFASRWVRCETVAQGDCPTVADLALAVNRVRDAITLVASKNQVKDQCTNLNLSGIGVGTGCAANKADCQDLDPLIKNRIEQTCMADCQQYGICPNPQVCMLNQKNFGAQVDNSRAVPCNGLPWLCSLKIPFTCTCHCM
jgi:hypothetical protein